jgi:hypothetical protein
MPFYNVSAVAEAVGMTEKQLDNLLSRNTLAGVERKTRGVSRRISVDAAVTIHLASQLSEALRVPVGAALETASVLQASKDRAMSAGAFVSLHADIDALRTATVARLDAAVEAVGRRHRGRPRVRVPGTKSDAGA